MTCVAADYYYCQDCKGHNRCEDEITVEPEEDLIDYGDNWDDLGMEALYCDADSELSGPYKEE